MSASSTSCAAILEPVALVKAAPNVPPGFLAGMRAHLEAAIANAREVDGSTLDELEQEMHVLLLGRCGNRTLMQTITLAQSLLIAHRFLYRWTPRLFESEPFLPEHLEIVERLEDGDAAEAARALGQASSRLSQDRAIARIAVVARELDPDDPPLPGTCGFQPICRLDLDSVSGTCRLNRNEICSGRYHAVWSGLVPLLRTVPRWRTRRAKAAGVGSGRGEGDGEGRVDHRGDGAGRRLSGGAAAREGLRVHGVKRRASSFNTGRIDHLYRRSARAGPASSCTMAT